MLLYTLDSLKNKLARVKQKTTMVLKHLHDITTQPLVATFDHVCMCIGDEVALYQQEEFGWEEYPPVPTEIGFSELQLSSIAIAQQLYHRFGVRQGDRVCLLLGSDAAGAEIASIVACARIGATWVPLDVQNSGRIESILHDSKPVAGVVVADSDSSRLATLLATKGISRQVYVQRTGSLTHVEAMDVLNELPEVPPLSKVETSSRSQEPLNHTAIAQDPLRKKAKSIDTNAENAILVPNAFYILYTSGSTGVPKGVLCSQYGLLNRISWQWSEFPYLEDEVVCRRSPLSFVDSQAEIFGALLAGVPMFCPHSNRSLNTNPEAFLKDVSTHLVTRITLVPTLLKVLLREEERISATCWESLHICVSSGELLVEDIVTMFHKVYSSAQLINLYGSTEVAGDCTFSNITQQRASSKLNVDSSNLLGSGRCAAPIGFPITGMEVRIISIHDGKVAEQAASRTASIKLDKLPTPSPYSYPQVLPDVILPNWDSSVTSLDPTGKFSLGQDIGYLVVSGSGLAYGYNANPGTVSSSRFVQTQDGKRWFLTGDCVQVGPAGLHWHSRIDSQVKVRGVRIELGEVEALVHSVLNIKDCVVAIVSETTQSGNFLVVCITTQDLERVSALKDCTSNSDRKLRLMRILRERLPSTLVPDLVFSISGDFPKTPSHKVDRVMLQRMVAEQHRTDQWIESNIDSAFSEDCLWDMLLSVLSDPKEAKNLHVANPTASLLELGANSLQLIEAVWKLQKWQSVTVSADKLGTTSGELLFNMISTLIHDPASKITTDGKQPDSVSTQQVRELSSLPDTVLSYNSLITPKVALRIEPQNFTVHYRCNQVQVFGNRISNSSQQTNRIIHNTIKLDRCVDASPIVVTWSTNQVVLIGSHAGDIVCACIATGEVLWKSQLGARIEASVCVVPGNHEPVVIVPTYRASDVEGWTSGTESEQAHSSSNTGFLVALSLATGAMLWQCPVAGQLKTTPVFDTVSLKCVWQGSHGAGLLQVAIESGQSRCTIPMEGNILATPVMTKAQLLIVATTSGMLYGVGSGDQPCVKWTVSHRVPIFSTPCFIHNHVYFCDVEGQINGLQVDSGKLLGEPRRLSTKPFFSSICQLENLKTNAVKEDVVNEIVVGGHDCVVRLLWISKCFDVVVSWETKLDAIVYSSPFEWRYKCQTYLIVCTTSGSVYILDRNSGVVIRHIREVQGQIFSSAVCVNDMLIVGSRDDRVHMIDLPQAL